MAVWEKIDRFNDRLFDETSAQRFFDQIYIIFLLGVIVRYTDGLIYTWLAVVVISVYAIEAFQSARIFLQGPPENKAAKAYDEGYRAGKSRAMRHMSDEPELSLEMGANPYEKS